MARVFISYCHQQGNWVWARLVPCLKAGGAEVLIDRERFEAGKGVIGQMDATQDQAEKHVLVLSPAYLHALPWMLIFTVTSQLALTGWVEWREPLPAGIWEPILFHTMLAGVGIAVGIAFGIAITRLYYHPLHLCFVWPTAKGHWYPYHPVAWDDLCGVPFPALDRLLTAYTEYAPEAGAREIERLINDYPTQRMAALWARVRLIAREAGRETRLARLDKIVARLPEGEQGFLAEARRLKELVGEISQLQRRLDTQDRPFLREPTAALLCKTIEAFRYQVSGFRKPLASEFRAAAARWAEIAARQLAEAQALLTRARTPQVFRAGDPVDRDREVFVYRDQVIGELE